ncbi:Rha family transcriptional regulator [Prevotella histicola]|uniref:Rha family transcriptional regulator n=1 Tax=Prevotella histicola TaxID=470565 RepID=UPI00068C8A5E|nr:Rha family transcriptional regulator [Prevotella histicola]
MKKNINETLMGTSGMSSIEVANVTGKQHAHILRDIRNLLDQGVAASNFGLGSYMDANQQVRPCYNLTAKGCLILASGYNPILREKIINRLEELEKQRIAEEINPELSANKFINQYKKKGKSDRWIAARFEGIQKRHAFTDTLKDHGVHGYGYSLCTDAIYKPLFGKTAKGIREERNLTTNSNLRDSMSAVELGATMLAELLATERLEVEHAMGNRQCYTNTMIASKNVAKAIDNTRKGIL